MKEYDKLTPEIREFIINQHMFFVATAPPIANGHVNVSPKGLKGTFQFITHKAANIASRGLFAEPALAYFAYLDIGGSGIETHAHLNACESKSITVCFTAFEGPPKILRLFGRGVSVEPGETGWNDVLYEFDSKLLDQFLAKGSSPPDTKIRNIVIVEVQRIRDSCGYGVPFMKYEAERPIYPARLVNWDNELRLKRRKETNTVSIDGLVGLRWAQDGAIPPTVEATTYEPAKKRFSETNEKSNSTLIHAACFAAGVGVTLALMQLRK